MPQTTAFKIFEGVHTSTCIGRLGAPHMQPYDCLFHHSRRGLYTSWIFALTAIVLGGFCSAGASETADAVSGGHVAWAKPLAGGPIRALFVAPHFTLGDVPELAARLDLQAETTALWSAYHIGYDPMAYPELPAFGRAEDTLAQVERQLRSRLDVITLANFDTDILPEALFSRILDKVAGGAGLLLIQLRNAPDSPLYTVLNALDSLDLPLPLTHGVAECAYPGGGPHDVASLAYAHGKGRIVVLDYPGDPSAHHCLVRAPADPLDMHDAYADNAWSLVARAMCMAAGRLGSTRIAEVRDIAPTGPDDDEIPPDFYPEFVQAMRDSVVAQPSRPFEVVLHEEALQRYAIEARLRRVDSQAQVSYLDPSYMARGARIHRFEIPVGPGVYFMDVWLRTRLGVADWYSTEITVSGWPEFHNLELDKTYLLPNDTLELSLDVRPVLNTTRRATIYARAMDSFDRLVSDISREVAHDGGPITLRLHFSDLIAPLLKIEIYAVEGQMRRFSEWELLASFRDVRYIGVRRRSPPLNLDTVAVTEVPDTFAHTRYLRVLRGLGMTTLHAPAGEASLIHAAREQLRLLPQIERFAVESARESRYREPCLNDPGYRTRLEEQLRDRTLRHWAGAWGRYSTGARNYLCATEENVCQCRHCMDRFQEGLRARHGDIARLNHGWRTDFGDWDFIELPEAMGPGQEGPIAPWVDFRCFMDNTFTDFHRWARSIITRADPGGEVGGLFAADSNPIHGYHWPALLDALDFAAIEYSPLIAEKLRSYSRAGAWSGVSLNGVNALDDARGLAWLPWRLLFNQLPAIWFEGLYGDALSPTPDAWLLPDGSPTESLTTIMTAARAARDTVAPLILAATPNNASIAIYDSHPSRHVYDVDTTYTTRFHDAQRAAAELLRFMGRPFVFIDKSRLQSMESSAYTALLLPMASALDQDEQRALQTFVGAGGALIADILPGVFDDQGVPRDNTAMAALFGVATENEATVERAVLSSLVANTGLTRDLGWVEANAGITLTSGAALANAAHIPAWITNRSGKGHALLLNYPFRGIAREGRQRLIPGEYNAVEAFIRDLPGMPEKPFTSDDVFLGDVYSYTYGNAKIIAVLTDYDAPRQSVRLPFARDDKVYDSLAGERISRPHRLRLSMTAGEVRVLTRLPYRVLEISLEAPEVIHAGQPLPIRVGVKPDRGTANKHMFLLRFAPRGGSPMPWYNQVITAETGIADLSLPLALNEIPGRYALQVRDMLTGMEAETIVAVSSPVD